MNDKTEQTVTDALRCTAAGGRAEIINVPGYPLMVRAVDYNTLRADLDRAIVNFGDAAATVCDMRAQLAEAQRDAERYRAIKDERVYIECPNDTEPKWYVYGATALGSYVTGADLDAAIDAAKGPA